MTDQMVTRKVLKEFILDRLSGKIEGYMPTLMDQLSGPSLNKLAITFELTFDDNSLELARKFYQEERLRPMSAAQTVPKASRRRRLFVLKSLAEDLWKVPYGKEAVSALVPHPDCMDKWVELVEAKKK